MEWPAVFWLPGPTAVIRSAIYTRTSSDEGLGQFYNSLHAQRDACEAYVSSQAGEGWGVLPAHYDDGGHSGGSLDRPAFRRLMADVEDGKVDAVVVYKVDRLTRSLCDFARLIQAFDRRGVSLVSVTQAFNTTSSMGRLTLNVLLSFAQFEREIAGERIRDKIARSKAKGLWMGGAPPLGYDPLVGSAGRTLKVNEAEAAVVRRIFAEFLQLGTTAALQSKLDRDGVRSKSRISKVGRDHGACRFSRGALNHILRNRTYLGQIAHKGAIYEGLHEPIIDPVTFDAAQVLLAHGSELAKVRRNPRRTSLLGGLLFDCEGQPMKLIRGRSNGRKYRYYASGPSVSDDRIRRTSAKIIEELVLDHVAAAAGVHDRSDAERVLGAAVVRVVIQPNAVHVTLRPRALATLDGVFPTLEDFKSRVLAGDHLLALPGRGGMVRLLIPGRLKRPGGRARVVRPVGGPPNVDHSTVRRVIDALRRAHVILKEHRSHPAQPAPELRFASGLRGGEVPLARYAFLAPEIQRAVLRGELPAKGWVYLDRARVFPLSWREQCELVGLTSEEEPRFASTEPPARGSREKRCLQHQRRTLYHLA